MDNGGNESILDTYLYETNTLLEQLDSIVLAAEQADTFTQNDVNEIFRIMHTIKGASAMMEYDSLSTVAHRIEDMFFIIREKTMDVIPDEDRAENYNRLCTKVYDCSLSENTITVKASLAGISRLPFLRYEVNYTFFADGMIRVSLSGKRMPATYLPRLGFEITSPAVNDGFTYFGMGSGENYCDCNAHAKMGRYRSTAREEYVPYILPQEHGNHTRTKYLKMDSGLTVLTDTEFEFSVSEYTADALTEAMHTNELVKNGRTNIRIDYKVSGLGTNSCGPELAEEYRLSEQDIHFDFYLK